MKLLCMAARVLLVSDEGSTTIWRVAHAGK
jgi:hypothetical protein